MYFLGKIVPFYSKIWYLLISYYKNAAHIKHELIEI